MRKLGCILLLIIAISCTSETYVVILSNPYKGIESKVRHRAICHEHITQQKMLENAINRGIDVLCISNYSPAVPAVPITGYTGTYEDWEFVKDDQGKIMYEKDSKGDTKIRRFDDGNTYKIPVLKRVSRTFSGGLSDFIKADGTPSDLDNIPQLPNGEHTRYLMSDGSVAGGRHINFVGSYWADAVNGPFDDEEGLKQYNQENGYNLSPGNLRELFALWSLQDIISNVKSNLMFPTKVFGTIDHPGFSSLRDWQVDDFMKCGGDVFKAMAIYNNSDSAEMAQYNLEYYDHTLLRGYRLWCVAEDDWGRLYNPEYPEHRGCNLLYLDDSYEEQSAKEKAEMALDAYINGCFSACGYGSIDLTNVKVDGMSVSVSFNCTPDKTVIDVDGIRCDGGSVSSLFVTVDSEVSFVRFEAYKDDDFIFTQPFFVERR